MTQPSGGTPGLVDILSTSGTGLGEPQQAILCTLELLAGIVVSG
ncbi:hypothetical protein [Paenibacillus uliginis]|nr:hypothetical protein [Paenibacillus uliginis]